MNVLIVGGSRGIGRAIAERLAGRGHGVGIMARGVGEVDDAVQACRNLGARSAGFVADVLDPASFGTAVRRCVESIGGIDALVYAAGRFRAIGPLVAVEPDAWWLDVETTLRGFAVAVRALVPSLARSDSPSIVALIGPGHAGELAFGSGYAAAQAGLARLVESLDVELRPQGIPAFALNPGLVPTPLMTHLLDGPEGRRWLPRFTEAFAEGKEVGPEVAAEMAAWLVEERPDALGGRVVAALLPPELLATRLGRIEADDLGKLRLR